MSGAVDWDQARRLNLAARRVNVDFPAWVVEALDREARRLGVTRQSLVSLGEIEAFFQGDVYVVRDAIVNGERRMHAFGDGGGRWMFCEFVWRGDRIRPVSVRYMHDKEVRRYVQEISRLQER